MAEIKKLRNNDKNDDTDLLQKVSDIILNDNHQDKTQGNVQGVLHDLGVVMDDEVLSEPGTMENDEIDNIGNIEYNEELQSWLTRIGLVEYVTNFAMNGY